MIAATVGHLYRIGEPVVLNLRAGYSIPDAVFVVVAQLPPSGRDLQYRIKTAGEPYERVVLESQLNRPPPRDLTASVFAK
jgi:hypothetical protein